MYHFPSFFIFSTIIISSLRINFNTAILSKMKRMFSNQKYSKKMLKKTKIGKTREICSYIKKAKLAQNFIKKLLFI